MQLKQPPSLTTPDKPQLHSRKCHHTYNATRSPPLAIWVRSLRFGPDVDLDGNLHLGGGGGGGGYCAAASSTALVHYEILLCYEHNRACTIYRTPQDCRRLRLGIGTLSPGRRSGADSATAAGECTVEDVEVLQGYLREAIEKKWRDCALEYFLRRRMEDCGGGV